MVYAMWILDGPFSETAFVLLEDTLKFRDEFCMYFVHLKAQGLREALFGSTFHSKNGFL